MHFIVYAILVQLLYQQIKNRKDSIMDDKIKAILSDDSFWDGVVEKLKTQQQQDKTQRELFSQSQTFSDMLSSLTQANQPLGFNSENFAYFPDKIKTELGWQSYTDEQIEQFIDVMEYADGLPKEQRHIDEECPFYNQNFEFHGLFVSILSGQGTIIGIHNKQAHEAILKHQE
jgi:hypothetical protein